jgi:hypothetical protein
MPADLGMTLIPPRPIRRCLWPDLSVEALLVPALPDHVGLIEACPPGGVTPHSDATRSPYAKAGTASSVAEEHAHVGT